MNMKLTKVTTPNGVTYFKGTAIRIPTARTPANMDPGIRAKMRAHYEGR